MAPEALLVATAALALALIPSCGGAGRDEGRGPTGILFGSLETDGRGYPYALYVPREHDPSQPWPLVVFLHGRGESGTDGSKPLAQGIGLALLRDAAAWPCLVLFPQKPGEDSEWEQHEGAVMAMVARVREAYRVDPARIYLTGLSQGGHGTWVLGARHPDLWAALVPVAGYGPARSEAAGLPPAFHGSPAELAARIGKLPVWAYHGAKDDVVPVSAAREMVDAVRAAGGSPRLTILPDAGHDSWDAAYGDPALREWLLGRRR